MKTYKFNEWSGFPLDQEVLHEMQNFYSSGMHSLFESLKPTQPILIGGCNVLTGTLDTGGTISDGIAYHPTHGLMTVVGGAFNDDASITIVNATNNLTFEGAIVNPAEFSKRIEIDNGGGDAAFVALVRNKWYNALSLVSQGAWTPIVNNADAKVFVRVNALTRIVEVRGSGLAQNSSSSTVGSYLTISGFNTTGTAIQLTPPPPFTQRTYGTFHAGDMPLGTQLFERSGVKIDGVPVWLDTSGRLIHDNIWAIASSAPEVIHFNFMYQL